MNTSYDIIWLKRKTCFVTLCEVSFAMMDKCDACYCQKNGHTYMVETAALAEVGRKQVDETTVESRWGKQRRFDVDISLSTAST